MKFLTKRDVIFGTLKKNSKKGDNGKCLIIGGSEGYVGCLALSGLAALRAGCDWVTIAAPSKVAWAINALSPDLVTRKFKGNHFSSDHVRSCVALAQRHDAVLIGMGIGTHQATKRFVRSLVKKLEQLSIRFVVDAEALTALQLGEVNNAVLTPHRNEWKHLTTKTKVCDVRGNIVIVKGPVDKILAPSRTFYNKTGNDRMAVAGTGDVLAGLVAGFLARGFSKIQASKNAVYINGKVGEILAKKKGSFFIASDLVRDKKLMRKAATC